VFDYMCNTQKFFVMKYERFMLKKQGVVIIVRALMAIMVTNFCSLVASLINIACNSLPISNLQENICET